MHISMREHIFDPDDRDLHTHDRQRTRANFSYDPTGLPMTLPNETRQQGSRRDIPSFGLSNDSAFFLACIVLLSSTWTTM
jgi:hypothetical protein